MLDPEGIVTTWNEGVKRIKGYSAEEIVGKHFSCFYSVEDVQAERPQAGLQEALQKGRYQEEGWRLRKDGAGFWASVVISPVFDDGTLVGFSKITRDITARKEAELELARVRYQLERRAADLFAANAELESFSDAISHDLQAPLRRTRGFVELLQLRHQSDLSEQAQLYLARIDSSTEQMSLLIDDLLAFSRLGRGDVIRKAVDLDQLAGEVRVEICSDHERSQDSHAITWTVGKLPQVVGDRSMIRLALVNLMQNAVKYTRGRVDSRIEIGCSECTEDQASIFIRDNGVGFDMKYKAKLFQIFQRLHSQEFEGTGVGLATVRRIVERHGGRVWGRWQGRPGRHVLFVASEKRNSLSNVSKAALS